jgi:hypothetical protein
VQISIDLLSSQQLSKRLDYKPLFVVFLKCLKITHTISIISSHV